MTAEFFSTVLSFLEVKHILIGGPDPLVALLYLRSLHASASAAS